MESRMVFFVAHLDLKGVNPYDFEACPRPPTQSLLTQWSQGVEKNPSWLVNVGYTAIDTGTPLEVK